MCGRKEDSRGRKWLRREEEGWKEGEEGRYVRR